MFRYSFIFGLMEHSCDHNLETKTKARLRPLLYKYGVSSSEKMSLEHIEGIVRGYPDPA